MEKNLPPAISGSSAKAKPAGWWSLPGHTYDGSREGVLKAISEATDVPARWKEHIAAEIAELGDEYNHVTVNAHVCLHQDGKKHQRIYDFDITGTIKL